VTQTYINDSWSRIPRVRSFHPIAQSLADVRLSAFPPQQPNPTDVLPFSVFQERRIRLCSMFIQVSSSGTVPPLVNRPLPKHLPTSPNRERERGICLRAWCLVIRVSISSIVMHNLVKCGRRRIICAALRVGIYGSFSTTSAY
jgi:hypothetical protein